MKNVLFVSSFLPFPLHSGGNQAIFNGMYALKDDINIFLAFPESYETPHIAEKEEFIKRFDGRVTLLPYTWAPVSSGQKRLDTIYRFKYNVKKIISGGRIKEHSGVFRYEDWLPQLLPQPEAFISHVNDIITTYKIDIVQCEMLGTAFFPLVFPPHVKTIFVEHEIGFVRKELQLSSLGDKSLQGTAHLEINKMLEASLLNKFDTVVSLSEDDTRKLRNAGVTSNILTSFAVVNTKNDSPLESEFGNVLSFVGPEWHPSNVIGLTWFLENCWGHLLNKLPEMQLHIVGRWSKERRSIFERKYQNVQFLGYVDDLASAIRNTIMIVPITIGSGIRMKILEACAVGVPVVTTTIGVEGLPLTHEKDCFVADSADSFVSSILRLQDKKVRMSCVQSAREVISEKYSVASLRANRLCLY